MKTAMVLALCLGACTADATSERIEDLVANGHCTDVSTFLFANDVSQASANQLAMTSHLASNTVYCVPAGEYFFSRPTNPALIASIDVIGLTDVTFIGGGESSAFTMYEDSPGGDCLVNCSHLGSGCSKSPWSLFRLQNGTSNVLFKNLALRSKGIAQYDEHTFLIQIGKADSGGTATINDVRVENVSFVGPCGDGIYLVGGNQNGANYEVTNVQIRASRFIGAHRRGITPNYNTRHLLISDSLFSGNNGAINFDITSDVADATIENNLFINAATESVQHIEIEGSVSSFAEDVHVVRNVLIGGGIDASLVRNVEIVDNVIVGPTDAAASSDVSIHSNTDRVDVRGNIVVRNSTFAASPIAFFASDAGDVHSDVAIQGNVVFQPAFVYGVPAPSTNIAAIRVENTRRHRVQNNVVTSAATANPSDPSKDNSGGIFVREASTALDSSSVISNSIQGTGLGPLGRGILVDAEGAFTIGRVAVIGNTVSGAQTGVELLKGAGTFTTIPFISTNVLQTAITSIKLDASVLAYAISGNGSGPMDLVGVSAPTSVVVQDGSTFVNSTASASPVFYVRVGGTWISK
jgi:hypothetical protein